MIIKGNTVGTTMPRTNYEQTDPKKADYLKGKSALDQKIEDAKQAGINAKTAADNAQTAAENANTAADNAKTAADNAQNTANDALPKVGGVMTGDIDMGSKKVTNLSDPTNNGDAANKQYVDGKHLPLTVNLLTASWVGDAAPYTQTVAAPGILETDEPHYGVVYSNDQNTRRDQKEAFAMVDDLITANGSVTFECFEEKPGTDLTIHLEVNR